MIGQKVGQTIAEARNFVKQNSLLAAESKYLAAITELEQSKENVNGKAELWSTKAEYLWFRSQFLTDGESVENSRERKLEAIRSACKAAKLGTRYESKLGPKVNELVKMTILNFGCIIREDDSHVHVECPIKIRNMGAGSYGFSIAIFFDGAKCSICGRDVVKDTGCEHIPGLEYNGKKCLIKRENLKIDHVALTTQPKQPQTGFTALFIPKNEIYANFSEEQIRRKIEFGLPLVCSLCRNEGIDPAEISAEKFFQMQGLELS